MECNFENCPNFERLGKQFADRISELEQENDSLKEEVRTEKIYSSQIEELEESLNRLKQENERLQKLTCFNCGEETLSPSGAEIYEKILVYKQTLQEIKAIAETGMHCEGMGCDFMPKILDLITKAEEE